MAVAGQARLVADGAGDRLAERDADILDAVVSVDMEIALGLDFEVDHAVAGDLVEHVIEKTNARSKSYLPRTVEVDLDPDLGLQGVTGNFP